MAIQATLNAEKREATRKGANRKLRATGRVPAVLYGQGGEALILSVDARTTPEDWAVAGRGLAGELAGGGGA